MVPRLLNQMGRGGLQVTVRAGNATFASSART
jgi:hypothetical protein